MEIQQEEPKLAGQQEDEPYTFENIPVYLSIEDSTVAFQATILQITPDGFTFMKDKGDDEWFTVYAAFSNTTSIGITCLNSLMVFVGEQDNNEYEPGQVPQIIKVISASKPGGNVILNGHCFSIRIDFAKEGKNVLQEVHDIFVNYMGDADQHKSRFDEDEEMGEMISADDIDENGNIINRQQDGSSDQDQELERPKESSRK